MQPLSTDATSALLRAIRAAFHAVGPTCTMKAEDIRSRSWASVTFTGARHELGFIIEGSEAAAAAERFAAALGTTEFRLRGHLLADIAMVASEPSGDGVRLQLEALTVEE